MTDWKENQGEPSLDPPDNPPPEWVCLPCDLDLHDDEVTDGKCCECGGDAVRLEDLCRGMW